MKKKGTTLSSVVLRPSLKTADNCWLFGSGSFWCKEVFFLSFFFLSFFSILVFVRVLIKTSVVILHCVCEFVVLGVFSSFCVCFSFFFGGARVMYVCAWCYRECVWMAKPKVCPNFLTSTNTTTTTTIPSRLPSPASPLTTSSTSSSRAKFFPFLPKLLDRVATLEK